MHLEEGQEGSAQKGCTCFSGARVTGHYQISTFVAIGPYRLDQESRPNQGTKDCPENANGVMSKASSYWR